VNRILMSTEDSYVEINVNDLIPDPINKNLYDEEEPVDMELAESIQEEGLKDRIRIDVNNVIIDGYRRWRILLFLGTEKTKCKVMHFENKRERALAIIRSNGNKKKRFSRIYNEINMLRKIYGPEAAAASKANLKQYANKPKLTSRLINKAIASGDLDPQERDSTLNPSEQWEDVKEFVTPLIIDEHNLKNDSGIGLTRNLIAKQIGIGGTTCDKIYKIGKMAEEGDPIAIMAVKNYDKNIWSVDKAYNVIEIRKFEKSKASGFIIARELIEKIEKDPKKAADPIKEWNKIKVPTASGEKYDILFTGASYDPHKYKKKLLPIHPKTILFWLTQSINIKDSISLIQRWGFNYQDCIPVYAGEDDSRQWSKHRYDLLLVCTKDHFVPDETMKFPEIMKSIDDVREAIEQVFPTQTKYELFKFDQLPGWGAQRNEENEDNSSTSPASNSRW